jgi:hypothetical protein
MTVFSPKGLLAGAALATASSFAFGISSAQAAPCTGIFGSLSGTCELATYSLTVTPATATLIFDPSGDSFSINSFSTTPATFDFTVTANPGFFFTQSSFVSGNALTGVTFISPAISLVPGDTIGFGGGETSISGTYTYFDSPSTLSFVTDVPVPLPVVGAGMAFGFTRRLRKRAKSMA